MTQVNAKHILVTGGSGLLGTQLQTLMPDALYPSSLDFNVTNKDAMNAFLNKHPEIKIIFHGAAFTSPPKVNEQPAKGIETNIVGTSLLTMLCMEHNIKLVYICTDYVFKGDKGLYKEDDPVHPVNKYAWSKLGGECAVRLYDNSLIIRTSLGPSPFPYDKAFKDQWTSREVVHEIAKKIVKLLSSDLTGVVHIGGKRQTVHQYAKSVSPEKDIGEISVHDVNFAVPIDTSLDTSKFETIFPK